MKTNRDYQIFTVFKNIYFDIKLLLQYNKNLFNNVKSESVI